jgi:putative SOS response-associated peptidase YedK
MAAEQEAARSVACRMLLIMEPEPDTWDAWLNGDPHAAALLMKSANEDVLVSRLGDEALGNIRNNGPELLA